MSKALTSKCVTLWDRSCLNEWQQVPLPFSNTIMDMFGLVQIELNLKEAQVKISTCMTTREARKVKIRLKWRVRQVDSQTVHYTYKGGAKRRGIKNLPVLLPKEH